MVKKVVEFIVKILIVFLICQIVNEPIVKADSWDEIISSGNNFIEDGKNGVDKDKVTDDKKLKETTDKIYNMLLAFGIVLAVVLGGILGIQIMWGSIEQQVKAKEMLMPYAAGCSVIFGAFGIWKLWLTIFSQL